MAQDYAKSTQSRGPQSHHSLMAHKSKLILLCLLLSAFALYKYSSIDIHQIQKGVYTKIKIDQSRPKELPKPKFEFYTRLPKAHNTFNEEKPLSTEIISNKNSSGVQVVDAKPVTHQDNNYLIQVASFKKLSDADNLRANLIMQGHTASLSQFKNSQTTWYRVELGPFTSLQQAKQKQLALEKANLNGLIKKIG